MSEFLLIAALSIASAYCIFTTSMSFAKRRIEREAKERAAEIEAAPEPLCKSKQDHYFWIRQGWRCPRCAAYDTRRREDSEREKLADLIVKKLKESNV